MRTLLFIVLVSAAFQGFAQKVRFSDTSNEWTIHVPYKAGHTPWWYENYSYIGVDSTGEYKLLTYHTIDLAWIREDTLAGKVYAKVLYSPGISIDTSEILLYDYSLQEGDTFRVKRDSTTDFEHIVANIDTVLIDNEPHRVFYFQSVSVLPGEDYEVIEGIGAKQGPLFPYHPSTFEESRYLWCFTTQGGNPFVDPAPFDVGTYVYNMGIQDYQFQPYPFHNTNTCQVLSVGDVGHPLALKVFPQPASEHVILTLDDRLQNGFFTMTNSFGQVISRISFNGKKELLIRNPGVAGIYFFRLYDSKNEKKYIGKIIFQ